MRKIYLVVSNISGHNTGRGGHLYTVSDHYACLTEAASVEILCIGSSIPAPLSALPVKLIRLRSLLGVLLAAKALRRHVEIGSVIHCFDAYSLLVARLAGPLPVLFTKCGGAVTRGYTPAAHPDVVFHAEDYAFYTLRGAPVPGRTFELIPNRVYPNVSGESRRMAKGDIVVMRVARICHKYAESFYQAIALTNYLRRAGVRANFVAIGFVEDRSILEEIIKRTGTDDVVLTDESSTVRASRHLAYADIVVATGRGVMESAILGKITCMPEKNAMLPALLSEETLREGLFHNFSDRSRFRAASSPDKFVSLVSDKASLEEYRRFLKDAAEKYFDIREKLPLYLDIYSRTQPHPTISSRKDAFNQWLRLYLARAVRVVEGFKR